MNHRPIRALRARHIWPLKASSSIDISNLPQTQGRALSVAMYWQEPLLSHINSASLRYPLPCSPHS